MLKKKYIPSSAISKIHFPSTKVIGPRFFGTGQGNSAPIDLLNRRMEGEGYIMRV
jgi:hypothetical protein